MDLGVSRYLQILLVIPYFSSQTSWFEKQNLIQEYEEILAHHAYCRLTFTDSGSGALQRLAMHRYEIDLVLIHQEEDRKLLDYRSGDHIAPETMNYFALGYKIKRMIPSKPVIITGPAIDSTGWEKCADIVLNRPFYPPTLIRKICQLVEDK